MDKEPSRLKSYLWFMIIILTGIITGALTYLYTLKDVQKQEESLRERVTTLQRQLDELRISSRK